MDRRQALQRLAVGAGTAAGSTLIQTAPAFAYATPSVSGALNASISTVLPGNTDAVLYLTFTTATCPGSADPITTTRTVRLTKIFLGVQRLFTTSPVAVEVQAGVGTAIAGSPSTIGIGKRTPGGAPSTWWPGNGSPGSTNRVRVQVTETHTCTYSDGTTRSSTQTLDRDFAYQTGGAWAY